MDPFSATVPAPDQEHTMSRHHKMANDGPWVELRTTDKDWLNADPNLLRDMYAQLVLIRVFEEYVLDLAGKGLTHRPRTRASARRAVRWGPRWRSAPRTPSTARTGDIISSSPRRCATSTPRASTRQRTSPPKSARSCSGPWARSAGSTAASRTDGIVGAPAVEGGRRHRHQRDRRRWVRWPQFRHGARLDGTDAVSVTCFGDGASNIGSTLETFNLAAAWSLPLCFFIENNLCRLHERLRGHR